MMNEKTREELKSIVRELLEETIKENNQAKVTTNAFEDDTNSDFRMNRTINPGVTINDRSVRSNGNSWVDTGEEKDGFDKLITKKRSPRNRKPATPVTVTCSACEKKYEISESLFRGHDAYYRCDRCVGN